MEQYKNFVDSLRDLFNDVIGFFIPGFLFIVVLLISIDTNTLSHFDNSAVQRDLLPWITAILSYVLGYVLFGLSLCINSICYKNQMGYQHMIEEEIKESYLYKDALLKYTSETNISMADKNITTRQLRTRIMSYIPESDNKIYSFRFRSDLCENSSKAFYSTGLTFLIIALLQLLLNFNVVGDSWAHFVFYLLVLLFGYLLTVVRDRYYDIAMRLPFTIYLAK